MLLKIKVINNKIFEKPLDILNSFSVNLTRWFNIYSIKLNMSSFKVLIFSSSNEVTSFLIFNRVSISFLLHSLPIRTIQIDKILIWSIIHYGHLPSCPNKVLIIWFKFKISSVIRSNQLFIINEVPTKLFICLLPFIKLLKRIGDKICEYFSIITPDSNNKTIIRNHLSI